MSADGGGWMRSFGRVSRKAVLGAGVGTASATVLAACGVGGSSGNAEGTKAAAPKQVTYVKTSRADNFDRAWDDTCDAAEKATRIKTTVIREPGGVAFW